MAQLGSLLNMDKPLSDEELIEMGRRAVAERELKRWGEVRRGALDEVGESTRRIKDKLAEMQDAGMIGGAYGASGLQELELAELLGVDRMTVRNWLGKQRRKTARSEAPADDLAAGLQ